MHTAAHSTQHTAHSSHHASTQHITDPIQIPAVVRCAAVRSARRAPPTQAWILPRARSTAHSLQYDPGLAPTSTRASLAPRRARARARAPRRRRLRSGCSRGRPASRDIYRRPRHRDISGARARSWRLGRGPRAAVRPAALPVKRYEAPAARGIEAARWCGGRRAAGSIALLLRCAQTHSSISTSAHT
jgi:hypothetical protein